MNNYRQENGFYKTIYSINKSSSDITNKQLLLPLLNLHVYTCKNNWEQLYSSDQEGIIFVSPSPETGHSKQEVLPSMLPFLSPALPHLSYEKHLGTARQVPNHQTENTHTELLYIIYTHYLSHRKGSIRLSERAIHLKQTKPTNHQKKVIIYLKY